MIRHDDRLLLGLSGGKDSLSLLHTLDHLKTYAPVSFSLGAATVDPQIDGFGPSSLKTYLAGLSVPYFYRSEPIMERARAHMDGDSFCSFCSCMRRGFCIPRRVSRAAMYWFLPTISTTWQNLS